MKNGAGRQRWTLAAGCFLLIALTLAVYWRSFHFGFINLDDPDYVTDNLRVMQGLTFGNLLWAFTSFHASNWHPLTWISHSLDVEVFGLNPAGHRAINVLLHVATTLLLYFALSRMTKAPWKSLTVAALFALHPLHVESVVWISERKDLLCAFFWMTTILAWQRYVRNPKTTGYLLVVASFVAALLSKPMAVTLPLVLLLLDYWPLGRWTGIDLVGSRPGQKSFRAGKLVWEKVPLLALSAGSAFVTVLAQRQGGAISSLEALPLWARISNAVCAYAGYLYKTVWPANLSVVYPVQPGEPPGLVSLALLLLVGATLVVWRLRRSRPYLFLGWFWFAGTLIPVIGLVQVGVQAMADRYTYIPLIGVFLLITWACADLARSRIAKPILVGSGMLVILVLAGQSFRRLADWENSETLFRQALQVTSGNYLAHNNLAAALAERGMLEQAQKHFENALKIKPNHVPALFGMGKVLAERGQPESALPYLERAMTLQPENASALYNYAVVVAQTGALDEARAAYEKALRLRPEYPQAHNNLAQLLLQKGEVDAGLEHARAAIRLDPHSFQALFNAGNAHFLQGDLERARKYYEASLDINPDFAGAHLNLAKALLQIDPREAGGHFTAVTRLEPGNLEAHQALAQLALRQNRPAEALIHYRQLLKLVPDWPEVLNNCAWILATTSDPGIRDPEKAVELALRACELTGRAQPDLLATLAAAYAEAGNFPEAAAAQQRALELWTQAGDERQAQKARQRLELYRRGQSLAQEKDR